MKVSSSHVQGSSLKGTTIVVQSADGVVSVFQQLLQVFEPNGGFGERGEEETLEQFHPHMSSLCSGSGDPACSFPSSVKFFRWPPDNERIPRFCFVMRAGEPFLLLLRLCGLQFIRFSTNHDARSDYRPARRKKYLSPSVGTRARRLFKRQVHQGLPLSCGRLARLAWRSYLHEAQRCGASTIALVLATMKSWLISP